MKQKIQIEENTTGIKQAIVLETSISVGILFAFVVALMCRHGAEIANIDSVHYLKFAQTRCWTDMPAHYGVGYPVFLRLVSLLGGTVLQTTAWGSMVCACLFGTILASWFFEEHRWTGLLGACAVLANYAILEDYARALSEELFLVGLVLGAVSLSRWRDSRQSAWFWISAVATGVACLTRYAGVPFALCFALCAWRTEKDGKADWLWSGAHLCLSFSGMALVALVHRMGMGTATNRFLDFHWAGANQLGDMATTISSWFIPDRLWLAYPPLPWMMLGIILLLCIRCFIDGWTTRNLRRLLWSVSVPAYLLFLYFSYSLFDADIPFDRRMLSPVVPFLVFGMLDVSETWFSKKKWMARTIMAGLTLFGILRAGPMVLQRFHEGAGWSSLSWNRSQTIQAVLQASAHVKIYSNAAGLLAWRGVDNVEGIVFWQLPTTEMDNPGFEVAYKEMLDDLENGRACLAHLRTYGWMKRTVSLERIVAGAGLEKLAEYVDGEIWGKPGAVESIVTDAVLRSLDERKATVESGNGSQHLECEKSGSFQRIDTSVLRPPGEDNDHCICKTSPSRGRSGT